MSVGLGAVILAAGKGERMGGPKGGLVVGGRPLVSLHAERMLEAGVEEVVIVSRPEVVARWVGVVRPRVAVVSALTAHPRETLSVALSLLGQPIRALLVTPVDVVPVARATIRMLVDALGQFETASPRYLGRGGHPVALRREVLERARSEVTLREILQGADRARVDVDDLAVTTDLDTPDDFLRAFGTLPQFVAQKW